MCTCPIHIRNPKKDFQPLNDKQWLEVPCGHCPECVVNSQLAWTTRLYYEWQNTLKPNGKSFYYTLTYNEQNVPWQYGFRVFSKRDIQLFLKRLRKNLCNYGYKEHIKYFVVSEYGHKNTQRPHYHIIVFVYQDVPNYIFYRSIRRAWCKKNSYKKSIGFIEPGKYGSVVNSVKALKYLCKYLQKDKGFIPIYENLIQKLVDDNPIKDNEDTLAYNKRICDLAKNFSPFHLQSAHLGECIINELDNSQKMLGECLVPSGKKNAFGALIYDSVPLPMYITRKLFYNACCPIDSKHSVCDVLADGELREREVGTIRYIINSDGIYKKLACIDKQIHSKALSWEEFRGYSDNDTLCSLLGVSTLHALWNRIDYLLDGRNFIDLATYDLIYKDRYDYGITSFKSDFQDFLTPQESEFANANYQLYNMNERFWGFDEILSYFKKFRQYKLFIEYNNRIDDYNQVQLSNHYLNPLEYPEPRHVDNIPLKDFIYK